MRSHLFMLVASFSISASVFAVTPVQAATVAAQEAINRGVRGVPGAPVNQANQVLPLIAAGTDQDKQRTNSQIARPTDKNTVSPITTPPQGSAPKLPIGNKISQ